MYERPFFLFLLLFDDELSSVRSAHQETAAWTQKIPAQAAGLALDYPGALPGPTGPPCFLPPIGVCVRALSLASGSPFGSCCRSACHHPSLVPGPRAQGAALGGPRCSGSRPVLFADPVWLVPCTLDPSPGAARPPSSIHCSAPRPFPPVQATIRSGPGIGPPRAGPPSPRLPLRSSLLPASRVSTMHAAEIMALSSETSHDFPLLLG